MMTIFEIPGMLVAWLIPYLIVISLASVNKTLTIWIILIMSVTDVNMSDGHSDIMLDASICYHSDEEVMVKSLNKNKWDLKESLLLLIKKWKETWLANMSTTLDPGENSIFRRLKARRISLNLSSIVPLIFTLWKEVRESKDKWWESMLRLGLALSSNFKMWLSGSKWALS